LIPLLEAPRFDAHFADASNAMKISSPFVERVDGEALARELTRLFATLDVADVDVAELGAWSSDETRENVSKFPRAIYANASAIALTPDAMDSVRAHCRERLGEDGADGDADVALCALCANGDHATAWNARKRRIANEREGFDFSSLTRELAIVSAIQSRFPKAPSAWAHRRWAIARVAGGRETDLEARQALFARERAACERASGRKKRNYAAWSHRAWALGFIARDEGATRAELETTEALVRRNVSDHCVMHYRSRVLLQFLRLCAEETEARLEYEMDFVRCLIKTYPGHESLWSYLRFVFAKTTRRAPWRLAEYLSSACAFAEECSDVEHAAMLDPTWAEHADATQRRLALTFVRFARLVVEGGRLGSKDI